MNLKQNNLRFPQNAKNKNSIIDLLLKLKNTSLWVILLFLTQSILYAQSNGSVVGTNNDTYVINKDNSNHSAVLRLQDPNSAWLLEHGTDRLEFRWANNKNHSNYGLFRMGIDSNGKLEVWGKIHAKGIYSMDHLSFHPETGRGLRFWNSDLYKIHMGNNYKYQYGPVTDYAIKMNMNNHSGRGWVWGVKDETPIAALNTQGNMKLAGTLDVAGLTINGKPLDTGGTLDVAGLHSTDHISLKAGNGRGFRFWNSDSYKIHMGTGSNYKYGPVTDYAIKMNMNNNSNRGWVWGILNQSPIAALNTQGNMKLKGNIDVASLTVGTDKKINGALAHFDGRVYISEENGTEEGFGSTTEDNYKDYLLWVEEGIVSTDFALAELTEWPDYVFYNDYKLPSLANVEKNIKENGHLHTMPSAKEVEENGFTVKDMTKRVVKTIEELTLHTIAQEKQIEAQNKLIEKLSKRLEKLEQANK